MTETVKIHSCTHCDYKSIWKHNVTRHMVTKQHLSNVHSNQSNLPNVISKSSNVISELQNVHYKQSELPNVHLDVQNIQESDKTCTKCTRIFTTKYTMLRHYEKCDGCLNKLQCPYCKNIFATRPSKCNHLKICRIKKEADSKALALKTATQASTSTNITNNITTNNNNNNTTNNNTTNNITINVTNIIPFQENEELLADHITKQFLRQLIQSHSDYADLLTNFSRKVLDRKENQCVRKTNLRSSSSLVHLGDDRWEAQADSYVYPRLLNNLAVTFSCSLDTYKMQMSKMLDQFIEDVTCNGEHGTSDAELAASMKRMYKNTINNVKHILFNLTKQTLGEQKAKAICESGN
jgi:hypothetical protein